MACKKCGGEIKVTNPNINYLKKCHSCQGLLVLDNNLVNVLQIVEEIEKIEKEHEKNQEKVKNISKRENVDEFVCEINCHECDTPMEKYEYMYSSGIYINRCPNCETIWLDQGELTKIKNYLENLQEYDGKINKLLPKIIEVKRQVNSTFQKIKEDSNPWFKSKKD